VSNALPFDRELADWQGRIAKAAASGGGLDEYRAALSWLKQHVPPDRCEKAKQEIQDAAERHLADTHGLGVIDAIYGAVFPEEVRDDVCDNNKLDECAIKIDDKAEIERLAKLGPIEYDRTRKLTAKQLGVTVSTLDREVANLCAANEAAQDFLPHWGVVPWAEEVGTAALLDSLSRYLKRYVILPEHAPEALALWILHTWVFERFDITPYLSITSPTKRCGKTVLMTLLYWLCRRGKKTDSVSKAAIYRSVERDKPTLCLDEVGWVLDPKDERQGILCGGFERNGYVEVCEGESTAITTRLFSTYCPKAFGLIGKLTPTLTDRSIVIPMRRKTSAEKAERLRRGDNDAHRKFRQQCLRWANDNAASLAKSAAIVLDKLNDRAADFWEPLLTIASLTGGGWKKQAEQAAVALSSDSAATSGDGEGVELLHDIKRAFDATMQNVIFTKTLIAQLTADEERPWAIYGRTGKPITDRKIAELLRPFSIISGTVRIGETTNKGYKLTDFEEAWQRWGMSHPSGAGQGETPSSHRLHESPPSQRHNVVKTGTSGDFSSVTENACDAREKCDLSNNDKHCDGVTDSSPPEWGCFDSKNGGRCFYCGNSAHADDPLLPASIDGKLFLTHRSCLDREWRARSIAPAQLDKAAPAG
jgi:hypothetical protein